MGHGIFLSLSQTLLLIMVMTLERLRLTDVWIWGSFQMQAGIGRRRC